MERIILINVKHLGVQMTEIYDCVEGESYGRLTNRLVAEFKQQQLEKALKAPERLNSDLFLVQ